MGHHTVLPCGSVSMLFKRFLDLPACRHSCVGFLQVMISLLPAYLSFLCVPFSVIVPQKLQDMV